MKSKLIIILFVFCSLLLNAQEISIKGKVVEKNTQTPLEFVTVVVYKSTTSKALSGTTTLENGEFASREEITV